MRKWLAKWGEVFTSQRLLAITLLSFSSGLPFSLTGSTLQAWFASCDINIKTIGLLGLVGLPYAWKFLWSPFIDRYIPPWLGRRRGWILIMQLSIALLLFLMASGDPKEHAGFLVWLALAVAFCSATQDVAIDAYRVDILPESERGLGVALTVLGYRVAIIVSGAAAMALAYYMGWRNTYFAMGGLMALCVFATWQAPDAPNIMNKPLSLREAVVAPLQQFMQRKYAGHLLMLILIYKLSDVVATALSTVFLLKGVGFDLVEVAAMNKMLGIASSVLGALVGGILLAQLSLYRGLLYFGIIQSISNLMFMWLAIAGKVYWLFALTVFAENFCGGLGTAAYFAFLMSLCDKRYSATQYALFSALFAQMRVLISPVAGVLISAIGWAPFFFFSVLAGIPGIVLLIWLRNRVDIFKGA